MINPVAVRCPVCGTVLKLRYANKISCLVLHLLLKHPNEEHLIRELKKFDGNPFENVAGGNVKFYAKEEAQEISLSALPFLL